MNIPLFFLILFVLLQAGYCVALYLVYNFIDLLHKRIDALFTIDAPQQNEATRKGTNLEELSEQNMLNIPANVKFEIEGQDNVPPGYDK